MENHPGYSTDSRLRRGASCGERTHQLQPSSDSSGGTWPQSTSMSLQCQASVCRSPISVLPPSPPPPRASLPDPCPPNLLSESREVISRQASQPGATAIMTCIHYPLTAGTQVKLMAQLFPSSRDLVPNFLLMTLEEL